MRAISKGQRDKVERALEQHEAYRKSYFWPSRGNRRQRDRWEEANTWSVGFTHEGVRYSYRSLLRCSAKSVYYRGIFQVNGERGNVRKFKKLVGQS